MKLFTSILALSLIWLIAKATAARSVANRNEVLDCSNSGHTSEDTDYEVENTKQLKKKVKTQTNDVINLGDDRLLTNSIDVEGYAADNFQKNNQYSNERFFSHSDDNEKNAVAKPVNLEGCNLTRPSAEQVMDEEAKYDISVSNIEIDPVLKLQENIPSIIETLICDSSMVPMLESIDYNEKCSVCLDSFEEITFQMTPIIKTRCGHCFCIHCLVGVISAAVNKYKCPYCQGLLGDLSNVIIANEHLDLLKMLSVNMSSSQLDEFLVAANCKNAPYVIYKYVIQIVYLSGNYELEKKLLFLSTLIPQETFYLILSEALKSHNNGFIDYLAFVFEINVRGGLYAIKADNAFETRKNFDLLRTFMLDSCTLINILKELINVNDGLSYYFPTVQYKVDTFVGDDDLNNRQDLQLLDKSLPVTSRPIQIPASDFKKMRDVFNNINNKKNATTANCIKLYSTYRNMSNIDGNSFLGNAIMHHNNKLVDKLLFSFAADPEQVNLGGMRPLHIAAWANNLQALKSLLRCKNSLGDKILLDPKDSLGFTPMDIASALRCYKIVECLVEAQAKLPTDSAIFSQLILGKELHNTNRDLHFYMSYWPNSFSIAAFQQILLYAIKNPDLGLFFQVVEKNPKFKFSTMPYSIFIDILSGNRIDTLPTIVKFLPYSPPMIHIIQDLVILALKIKSIESFNAMIDNGFGVHKIIDHKTGNNILHFAAMYNSTYLLHKLKALPKLICANKREETPVDIALSAGNHVSIKYFLDIGGLSILSKGKTKQAISQMLVKIGLHGSKFAGLQKMEEVFMVLLRAGFDVDTLNINDESALKFCYRKITGQIMARLIQRYDLSNYFVDSMDILHYSVKKNDLESLGVLKERIFNNLSECELSETVVMFAIKSNCSLNTIKFLVDFSLSKDRLYFIKKYKDIWGLLPKDVNPEIIKIFLDAGVETI